MKFYAVGTTPNWSCEYSLCLQIHPQLFHIRYPENEESITCGHFFENCGLDDLLSTVQSLRRNAGTQSQI